jgi:rhodanese-related sulfurtransferase
MPTRIDADRVIRLVARGAPLFDVLPRTIYQQEHLPGARSAPLETFDVGQYAGLDPSDPVIVYCFDQH